MAEEREGRLGAEGRRERCKGCGGDSGGRREGSAEGAEEGGSGDKLERDVVGDGCGFMLLSGDL